jgi:hypothetical protein
VIDMSEDFCKIIEESKTDDAKKEILKQQILDKSKDESLDQETKDIFATAVDHITTGNGPTVEDLEKIKGKVCKI